MAATASNQRATPTRRAKKAASATPARPAKKAASATPTRRAKKAASATPARRPAKRAGTAKRPSTASRVTRRAGTTAAKAAVKHPTLRPLAAKAASAVARRLLRAGAGSLRSASGSLVSAGRNALETSLARRPPIQVGVDVAVPLEVAWDQWMQFDAFTEGAARIEGVNRDGTMLHGHLGGPGARRDWEAEIVDEREHEAFAWRSVAGTDCAGLITFHRLSDRLTRLELDLDVLPTNPVEAVTLAMSVGRRRAEAELRRFKAHVEFINPDVYEKNHNNGNGAGRDADDTN